MNRTIVVILIALLFTMISVPMVSADSSEEKKGFLGEILTPIKKANSEDLGSLVFGGTVMMTGVSFLANYSPAPGDSQSGSLNALGWAATGTGAYFFWKGVKSTEVSWPLKILFGFPALTWGGQTGISLATNANENSWKNYVSKDGGDSGDLPDDWSSVPSSVNPSNITMSVVALPGYFGLRLLMTF